MNKRIVLIYTIFIAILSISIGYSAFGSKLSIGSIAADVRIEADIRVTGMIYSSSIGDGLSSYEEYSVNSLLTNVSLPNENSSITYKVKVTNFGNTEMGIYSINNLPSNLTYELSEYTLQDKLCDDTGSCSLGAITDFYITIKYKENGYDSTNTNYNLNLSVDFREIYTITYEGITINNYPSYIIDGGNLNITFTDPTPPKIIAYTNGVKTDKNLYSYNNSIFNYTDVDGNLILEYREKVYLTTLSAGTYFKEDTYRTSIQTVSFVDYIDTSDSLKTYDLSAAKDQSIIGWIDGNNNLYIGSEWNIFCKDLSYAFYSMSGVTNIYFENLNTSEATSMYYMFNGASSLASLDLTSFDTSSVTNMGLIFYRCSNLVNLDISSFDTNKVTNMSQMFNSCEKLQYVDATVLNTSKIGSMEYMFLYCRSLEQLDVSNFDTSNVTSMYFMFTGCSSLKELNVSNFDTSNVKNMNSMFSGCGNLINLELSNFDTSNVTSMYKMFNGCGSLISLDVRNFDTSKVTNMSGMFRGCYRLTDLDLSNFDTSNVTSIDNMFNHATSLENLDIRSATFDKIENSTDMFTNTSSEINVIVKSDTEKAWIEDKLGEGVGTVVVA